MKRAVVKLRENRRWRISLSFYNIIRKSMIFYVNK